MTTRSLTAVKVNGKYKVANYGHYDGYPLEQGIYALDFLLNKMQNDKFQNQLSKLQFAKNEKEEDEAYDRQKDCDGALILEYLQDNNDYITINSLKFAQDTICCQWAYLIDFDNNTFEIYSNSRYSEKYSKLNNNREFRYLNLIRRYDLDNLPALETFKETFDF